MKATAFQSLQTLFPEDDEQLQELRNEMFVVKDPNLVALAKHPVFPDRSDYLPNGLFRSTGNKLPKDLGDNDRYQQCKQVLAEKIVGRTIPGIFEEPTPGPFLELLYFDERGSHYMIGPKTCEKLARDFADHRGQAERIGGAFYSWFSAMQELFEMASRSGAVRFTS